MATYNAKDFTGGGVGYTGAAIQAAYDYAVVDQGTGGERGATLYVPRVPGQKSWKLTEPLRIGPGHQVSLAGDCMAAGDQDWGGTLLDATAVVGPAIWLQGGVGMELRDFAVRFGGGIGLHFDGHSGQSISSRRMTVRNVALHSTTAGAIGVLVQGHGLWANWGGVNLNNDQVASETLFDACQFDIALGTGFKNASKQAVNVWLQHCSIGGAIGVEVVCGGVHITRCNMGGPAGAVHIQQHGQPQHFSTLNVTETYHEGNPAACFRGLSANNRTTRLTGCRFYVQADGYWIDSKLKVVAQDCTFEANSGVTGSNRMGPESVLSRPCYVQW